MVISKHTLSDPGIWVESYADYLFSFALYRVTEKSTAEDLVQDTFLAALSARAGFKGNASEKTWLTAILKKKILDHFRKRYRESANPDQKFDNNADSMFFDDQGNWTVMPQKWHQNPQRYHEQKEFMSVLTSCLKKMSPKQADAFRLKELIDADTDEICKVLQISATNYWVVMHRARLQIRRCLENDWLEIDPDGVTL